ncbi:TPA: PA3496 family putative envelope integrity protein [Legionella feeleii]|uniref:Uncharacterized protein n=1 Tax=Legionella feeleii TaxID=453 RepID=A0A0W0U3N0_9GAMM|nr:hypothetical protein [Legionella feeleii]KTD02626.1 hypothetical protein Lfee_0781 [Legionella feeleii]SPX61177.1 Uncharacterised protein [Legionella feeleii]STX37742.1 Uncharacterised protein [Legionella feeleii]
MSTQRFDDFEIGLEENINSTEMSTETHLSTKLERRRRIEDIFEQKRLREELGEFDLA